MGNKPFETLLELLQTDTIFLKYHKSLSNKKFETKFILSNVFNVENFCDKQIVLIGRGHFKQLHTNTFCLFWLIYFVY